MKKIDLMNLRYENHVTKKKVDNTLFLIDEITGALFTRNNEFDITTFKDADGNKWAHSEGPINANRDLTHLMIGNGDGAYGIDNLYITGDIEGMLHKALQHFLPLVEKDNFFVEQDRWTIFLN